MHGVLDYLVGFLLIVAPWLLGFARGGAETWTPVILGLGAIIYSLVTDYELGVAPVLSMKAHLLMDVVSGSLLAISPWLFRFSDLVWLPHLVVGVFEIGAGLFTRTVRGTDRREVPIQTV